MRWVCEVAFKSEREGLGRLVHSPPTGAGPTKVAPSAIATKACRVCSKRSFLVSMELQRLKKQQYSFMLLIIKFGWFEGSARKVTWCFVVFVGFGFLLSRVMPRGNFRI